MELANKVFVVTGGGNGMGREIVLNLLARGAKVVAADINENALNTTKELAGDLSDNLMVIKADITDVKDLANLPQTIIDKFGQINGIINNAGIIQPFCSVKDIEMDVVDRIFKINFFGALNMIKVFLPFLLESTSGCIVNVSSMGGFLPIGGQSIYGASKSALAILSEGLTTELKKTCVKVMTVFPGAMNTDIKKNSGIEDPASTPQQSDQPKNNNDGPLSPIIAAAEIVAGIEEDKQTLFVGKDSVAMDKLVRENPMMAIRAINERIHHKV